jgi:hypothetical protein
MEFSAASGRGDDHRFLDLIGDTQRVLCRIGNGRRPHPSVYRRRARTGRNLGVTDAQPSATAAPCSSIRRRGPLTGFGLP